MATKAKPIERQKVVEIGEKIYVEGNAVKITSIGKHLRKDGKVRINVQGQQFEELPEEY